MDRGVFHLFDSRKGNQSMSFRPLDEAEYRQAIDLWAQSFEHGSRDRGFWDDWEAGNRAHRTPLGIFDESSTLQAAVLMVRYRVHLGSEVVAPLMGINAVGSLPAARGKGYAKQGMQYAFEQMREAGHFLSMLEPFSFDFYGELGYSWLGVKRRISVPSRLLRVDAETVNVRAATATDRTALRNLYTRFAHRYRGAIERRDWDWQDMLDDKKKSFTYTYVHERDGEIEGYLSLHGGELEGWQENRGHQKKEARIREFICVTPEAQRGLLGLLKRHDMQIESFVWHAPIDDTFWLQFCPNEMQTKLSPLVMGRIVDVPAALAAWCNPQRGKGSIALAVTDKYAPWNEGTWQIEYDGANVTVEKTSAAPQVTLGIAALTQAYFGTPSLTELRAADQLTVHSESGFSALRDMLNGPPMWINDGF